MSRRSTTGEAHSCVSHGNGLWTFRRIDAWHGFYIYFMLCYIVLYDIILYCIIYVIMVACDALKEMLVRLRNAS